MTVPLRSTGGSAGSARYGQRPTSMRSTPAGSAGLISESPPIQAGTKASEEHGRADSHGREQP